MAYQPIEHYGIIGNMRTARAGRDERLHRLARLPHFDSPSVFAANRTTQRAGGSRLPQPAITSGTGSSTGRTPPSSLPVSCTKMAWAR